MAASIRGIIFAIIAALILMGAVQPSQPPAQREQIQAATNQQRPAPPAHATASDREPPDLGCPNGGDNRQSDLCAQWKAADAARDAANASWVQTYTALTGLLIAFSTLIFAGLAARWAKKAAVEAEGAAMAGRDAVVETKAANKIAQEAQRAWLSVVRFEIDSVDINVENNDASVSVIFDIRNSGSRPAVNLGYHITFYIYPEHTDRAYEILIEHVEALPESGFANEAVGPGQTLERHLTYPMQNEFFEPPSSDARYRGFGGIRFHCQFRYETPGHDTPQTTFLSGFVVTRHLHGTTVYDVVGVHRTASRMT